MKRICVLTATRAEYGLLKNLILRLSEREDVQTAVAVTGAHLAPEFGETWKEIEEDGIPIDRKIPILEDGDDGTAVSRTMAAALTGFGRYFEETRPDMLVVLGDRYETLAVCIAAMNARIPIAHLHGGETTQGAVDEAVRHAVTKLSYLHFTSTEEYRKRVIQLGEAPERVYTVGAPGVENILEQRLLPREELEKSIGFSLRGPYALVTFHPVTLEGDVAGQAAEVLAALEEYRRERGFSYLITKANADAGGRAVNRALARYAKEHSRDVLLVDSLGMRRYLSAVKYCSMVVGNSSSGIIEAPSLGAPTVNIGDRQKGRVRAESVIDCRAEKGEIVEAMKKAEAFAALGGEINNPYLRPGTSRNIADILCRFLQDGIKDLKKEFYDIDFDAPAGTGRWERK